MLLQGMEGGWVVIEASHTVSSGNMSYVKWVHLGYISPTATIRLLKEQYRIWRGLSGELP